MANVLWAGSYVAAKFALRDMSVNMMNALRLMIAALVLESFFTVRGKALLVKHSPLLVTAAAIVGSTVFWIPLGGYELLARGWHPVSWQGWLGLLWLALMSTVVGYLAWFKGLERVEGSSAATTLF